MGKSAINPAVVGEHSTEIAALKNDLGIVEDGDTATHTIAQGQYVIWQGALYTADAAIASGTTLAASGGNKNLTAVENGGLNALNNKVTPSSIQYGLNNKIRWKTMGNLCELIIYGLAFTDASNIGSAGVPAPASGYVSVTLHNSNENCGNIEYANGAWSGTKNASSGYTTGYGTIMYFI